MVRGAARPPREAKIAILVPIKARISASFKICNVQAATNRTPWPGSRARAHTHSPLLTTHMHTVLRKTAPSRLTAPPCGPSPAPEHAVFLHTSSNLNTQNTHTCGKFGACWARVAGWAPAPLDRMPPATAAPPRRSRARPAGRAAATPPPRRRRPAAAAPPRRRAAATPPRRRRPHVARATPPRGPECGAAA